MGERGDPGVDANDSLVMTWHGKGIKIQATAKSTSTKTFDLTLQKSDVSFFINTESETVRTKRGLI